MTTIAVTGASGFVGTALVHHLATAGARIVATDRFPPTADLPAADFIVADLGDGAAMARAVQSAEVVFHLGALPAIARATEDVYEAVNVAGTERILALARDAGARKVVYMSSSTVYGAPDSMPVLEGTPLSPRCPYSRSKVSAEAVCERFALDGMDVDIIRPRVVVGPGRAGIFALLFECLARHLPIPLPGGARNRFQLTAVDDLVRACADAMNASHPGQLATYNIGSDVHRPLVDDLRELVTHAGSRSPLVPVPAGPTRALLALAHRLGVGPMVPEQYGILTRDFVLDTSHAHTALGFTAARRNVDGLLEAWDWWSAHRGDGRGGLRRWWKPRHQNLLQNRQDRE